MFSRYSRLGRLYRRFVPIDGHAARGEPRNIGRKGSEAGVWICFALDGKAVAFLACRGECFHQPIAIVFGSGDELQLTRRDFRVAKSIARDWTLADATDSSFDLRDCTSKDPRYECLLDLVLFATDRAGGARYDGEHFGGMYIPEGGFFSTLDPDSIPWEGTGRRRPGLSEPIPTFTLNVNADWTPAPAGLKDHLDRIDPLPDKNGGHSNFGTRSPGQQKRDGAEVAA